MAIAERVTRILAGDRRAIAALIRDLDDDRTGARDMLRALRAEAENGSDSTGNGALVVGITGGPGAGKSTLVDALITHWRSQGQRVGVVAVDPSSPLGGGAVLGDRVRMQRHAMDPGVFIRSVASRGAAGGLSRSAIDVVAVVVAGGFSRVLVETVGVGQAEVDVAAAADVTLVVMTPGLGDDIQTLKAGILEIADILVLNKADRPGAASVVRDLQAMLSLRAASAISVGVGTERTVAPSDVEIVSTVATTGQGIADLVGAIDRAAQDVAKAQSPRWRRRAAARILGLLTARIEQTARAALGPGGTAEGLVKDVAASRLDVEDAVKALMERLCAGY